MTNNFWIDIGVNLTDSSFDKDREQVIDQAYEHNIEKLIITGTTVEESHQAIELCQRYPNQLFCTVGIHPHYAKDHSTQQFESLRSLYKEDCVVAVGETGLDFNRNFSTPEQQVLCFEKQLEMASETKLPLFLHERDAHKKQIEMLQSHRDDISAAVAHCFTGTKSELYNYLDLDLHIGITGWICDERRGQELQMLAKDIPEDRLMLETDAPYLIPRDLKPKPKSRRNLPLYLPHIAAKVAELRGTTIEELKYQVQINTQHFFGLGDTH
ncbi:TatD family hydrolase [Neptuniibacter caesariensis]|uniref:TatD-related deoxyribonuclease n=1 Tax=Neptuniibacter caesariensis TaxID=207954 RepID=A0A7U8C523_NEPCE|nr:TatD family hydrolase [Neptuniibacter caesariensis]EAR61713.1 TatD-related deoxyribonuclease [Neptuniibacter caesariensis]